VVDLFSDPGSIPGASIKRNGPAKGGAVSFELSAISHQLERRQSTVVVIYDAV